MSKTWPEILMGGNIVLDAVDTDRLLRLLYNGTRPKHVHTLVCGCNALADLRVNENAWSGWQVLPFARCPRCLSSGVDPFVRELYPLQARRRFEEQLRQWRFE